jgi:hypothetical protein
VRTPIIIATHMSGVSLLGTALQLPYDPNAMPGSQFMVSYVSQPLPGVTEADSALFARCFAMVSRSGRVELNKSITCDGSSSRRCCFFDTHAKRVRHNGRKCEYGEGHSL